MIQRIFSWVDCLRVKPKGQDLSEYGLLVGFIAILLVAAVTLFGVNLLAFWNRIAAAF